MVSEVTQTEDQVYNYEEWQAWCSNQAYWQHEQRKPQSPLRQEPLPETRKSDVQVTTQEEEQQSELLALEQVSLALEPVPELSVNQCSSVAKNDPIIESTNSDNPSDHTSETSKLNTLSLKNDENHMNVIDREENSNVEVASDLLGDTFLLGPEDNMYPLQTEKPRLQSIASNTNDSSKQSSDTPSNIASNSDLLESASSCSDVQSSLQYCSKPPQECVDVLEPSPSAANVTPSIIISKIKEENPSPNSDGRRHSPQHFSAMDVDIIIPTLDVDQVPLPSQAPAIATQLPLTSQTSLPPKTHMAPLQPPPLPMFQLSGLTPSSAMMSFLPLSAPPLFSATDPPSTSVDINTTSIIPMQENNLVFSSTDAYQSNASSGEQIHKRKRTSSASSSDSIMSLEPPEKVVKVIETVTIDEEDSSGRNLLSKSLGDGNAKNELTIEEMLRMKKLELLRVHEREEAKRVAKNAAKQKEIDHKAKKDKERFSKGHDKERHDKYRNRGKSPKTDRSDKYHEIRRSRSPRKDRGDLRNSRRSPRNEKRRSRSPRREVERSREKLRKRSPRQEKEYSKEKNRSRSPVSDKLKHRKKSSSPKSRRRNSGDRSKSPKYDTGRTRDRNSKNGKSKHVSRSQSPRSLSNTENVRKSKNVKMNNSRSKSPENRLQDMRRSESIDKSKSKESARKSKKEHRDSSVESHHSNSPSRKSRRKKSKKDKKKSKKITKKKKRSDRCSQDSESEEDYSSKKLKKKKRRHSFEEENDKEVASRSASRVEGNLKDVTEVPPISEEAVNNNELEAHILDTDKLVDEQGSNKDNDNAKEDGRQSVNDEEKLASNSDSSKFPIEDDRAGEERFSDKKIISSVDIEDNIIEKVSSVDDLISSDVTCVVDKDDALKCNVKSNVSESEQCSLINEIIAGTNVPGTESQSQNISEGKEEIEEIDVGSTDSDSSLTSSSSSSDDEARTSCPNSSLSANALLSDQTNTTGDAQQSTSSIAVDGTTIIAQGEGNSFVYSPELKLYYDPTSGYYYDSVSCL